MHICNCPGENHPTFGACVRAKSIRVGYCQSAKGHDRSRQGAWDRELQAYRDARAQGVEPHTTRMPDIQRAMDWSDRNGRAFKSYDNTPMTEPIEL